MYYAFKIFDVLIFQLNAFAMEMMIKVLRNKILLATVCWRLPNANAQHGEDHTKTKWRKEFFIMARL